MNNNALNPAPNPVETSSLSFKKKLKYGTVAITFTVVFIAVVLIINIITTAIHSSRPMFIDMTTEQVYGISDATRELLQDITAPVEIVFFQALDVYENISPAYYSRMIVNIAKSFANEFDNVSVVVKDIIKDPNAGNQYKTSSMSNLNTTSVVVNSGSSSKIIAYDGFFSIAQSTSLPFSFNGEKQLSSAILQVTSKVETVYFTTGHGESESAPLEELFNSAGYVVEKIDLMTQDMDPDVKIAVVVNPIKDFIGTTAENQNVKSEVEKLASFLNNFGNLMYFSDPTVGELPEIEDLLREYGIEFENNTVIVDQKNSVAGTSGLALSTQYVVSETAGDELHSSIRNQPSLPRTVVYYAKPMHILPNAEGVTAAPVLKTYDTATVNSESAAIYTGEVTVMTMSQKTRYIDNEPKSTLVLACGSVGFLDVLSLPTYANSDMILNAVRIMGSRKVPVDIKIRVFDNFSLDMTIEEQSNLTMACILVLPVLIIGIGLTVWFRRRHS